MGMPRMPSKARAVASMLARSYPSALFAKMEMDESCCAFWAMESRKAS